MRQRWPQIAIFLVVAILYLGGALDSLERGMMDLRFHAFGRPATGDLVIVEIDARSLQELDTWPWPRSYHARVLENLVAAGADRIALDIDFSSRSTEEADDRLSRALAVAPRPVLLPAFRQSLPSTHGVRQTIFAEPLPQFAQHARMASVNVWPDSDGLVRQFLWAGDWKDSPLPSMAALLAGMVDLPTGAFYLDFGIDPASIPRLSYFDVLRGKFDPAAVAGKKVIIGAAAIELGDQVSVPVFRTVPGPVLQALAYESLVQGRTIERIGGMPLIGVTLILVIFLGRRLDSVPWRKGLAVTVGLMVGVLISAGAVHAIAALSIDYTPLCLPLLFGYVRGLIGHIDQRDLRLLTQSLTLRRQDAFMRGVVEHSFDGILTVDEAGIVRTLNQAAVEIFGYQACEVIGQDFRVLITGERDGSAGTDIARDLGTYATPKEIAGRRKTGDLFPIDFVASQIRVEERIHHVVLVRDITTRKLAEERARNAQMRLQEAIESVSDGFMLYDAEDHLVISNDRARQLHSDVVQLLTPDRKYQDIIQGMVEAGRIPEALERPEDWIRNRMADHRKCGAAFEQRLSDGTWLRIGESRTLEGGVVSVLTDITEMKDREAVLEEAKIKAELADRAKSEFLAMMSHELRTPLNAVIGFSDVIKGEILGPLGIAKYREYAQDINASGQHLLGIVNDILDLSKIESGDHDLHEDEIHVPAVVRSVCSLVNGSAEKSGVELVLEISDDLLSLRADERKLKQILFNLLSNAIKFTRAGGKVALGIQCRADSGYIFEITDTGIGMAPEDIPKAMSPFAQVDSDLSREYEGTGLGLPLTKALVELHGGSFELRSEVGVGTTVTVRFPAERIVASLDNAESLDVEAKAAS